MVRIKYRYSVLQITTENNRPCKMENRDLISKIFPAVRRLHGCYGVAVTDRSFQLKYVNTETGIAMVKLRRGPHTLFLSALPFVNKDSNNRGIRINTLYTGATIKQCFLYIKKYHMDEYEQIAHGLNDEEKQMLRKAYISNMNLEVNESSSSIL